MSLCSGLNRHRLQLHGAIYRPDSFVLILRYCGNLKAIRYVSTSLNRIVADTSHSVIVAILNKFKHSLITIIGCTLKGSVIFYREEGVWKFLKLCKF